MELTGRIDELKQFLIETEEGEDLCILFVTSDQEEIDADEFDLADVEEGPVVVTCESFDGEDAWGVTAVVELADDGDDDSDEDEDEDATVSA